MIKVVMAIMTLVLVSLCSFAQPAELYSSYRVNYSRVDNGNGTSSFTITMMDGAETVVIGIKTINNVPNSNTVRSIIEMMMLELKSRALHELVIDDMPTIDGFTVDQEELVMIRDSVED